jgi:hypothetical protein
VNIPEEAYSEALAEIEGLKREVALMASKDYVHSLRSEIWRLKALLIRAADALEEDQPMFRERRRVLIAAVREAAE